MTDIKLYDGCWVKTGDGAIIGPVQRHTGVPNHERFACCQCVWFTDGTSSLNHLYDETEPEDESWDIIAVYPSLVAAAAENPEM